MFRRLRVAIGFLTILPVSPRQIEANDFHKSVPFFPMVGILYGLFTWGIFSLGRLILPIEVAAWLAVFATAIFNGCIHWDGFADTADGLGSSNPERSRLIMKDSRLGAFGGMALSFLILGKVLLFPHLIEYSPAVFIAVAILARWSMAVAILTQPSVSQGLAQMFKTADQKPGNLLTASILMLAGIAFALPQSAILLGLTGIGLWVWFRFIKQRFGGITGDLLGATNELVELACYLVLNIKY